MIADKSGDNRSRRGHVNDSSADSRDYRFTNENRGVPDFIPLARGRADPKPGSATGKAIAANRTLRAPAVLSYVAMAPGGSGFAGAVGS